MIWVEIRVSMIFETAFVECVSSLFSEHCSVVPGLFGRQEFLVKNRSFVSSLTSISIDIYVTHFNYKIQD